MTLSFHFLSGPGPILWFVAAVGLIVAGSQLILNRPIATQLLKGLWLLALGILLLIGL